MAARDPPPLPPALWLQRGRALVWGAGAARALRERQRVSGRLVGVGGGGGGAGTSRARLPLQLLPEEARLLAEGPRAPAPVDPNEAVKPDPSEGPEASPEPHLPPPALLLPLPPLDEGGPLPPGAPSPPDLGRPSPHWPHGGRPPHERRYRVYRDLWGRGLHLTGGSKFGGDFLVYPGPPERFHAAAVALCPPPGAALPLGGLVAAARLGTHVRKTLLLCTSPAGGAPAYTSLQWRRDL